MEKGMTIKPMVYKVTQEFEVLAYDSYKGLDYAIISVFGRNPCGYVNVSGTFLEGKDYMFDSLNDFISCHGGLTYSRKGLSLIDEDKKSWWIGWDYGHSGDFVTNEFNFSDWGSSCNGIKWTTEAIVLECKSVIEQILNNRQD